MNEHTSMVNGEPQVGRLQRGTLATWSLSAPIGRQWTIPVQRSSCALGAPRWPPSPCKAASRSRSV